MQPDSRDVSYLWDMLDEARSVSQTIAGLDFEQYCSDANLRRATERRIEIIGEAASHVSKEFRAQHPEIPWAGIIGQRHILAHGYADIEDELIWRVATERIPELINQLEALIPSNEADSG